MDGSPRFQVFSKRMELEIMSPADNLAAPATCPPSGGGGGGGADCGRQTDRSVPPQSDGLGTSRGVDPVAVAAVPGHQSSRGGGGGDGVTAASAATAAASAASAAAVDPGAVRNSVGSDVGTVYDIATMSADPPSSNDGTDRDPDRGSGGGRSRVGSAASSVVSSGGEYGKFCKFCKTFFLI